MQLSKAIQTANPPNDQALKPSSDSAWREVSMDEFYKTVGPLNVNGNILPTPWPYTTHVLTPSGQVRGKIVGYLPEASALEAKRYYLPNIKN